MLQVKDIKKVRINGIIAEGKSIDQPGGLNIKGTGLPIYWKSIPGRGRLVHLCFNDGYRARLFTALGHQGCRGAQYFSRIAG